MQSSETDRLNYAAELLNDFVVDWNVNTNEVFLSEKWKNVLGYKGKELENTIGGWLITVYPGNEKLICDLSDLKKGLIPVLIIERKALCKDGSFVWIVSKTKIIKWNEDGSASRIIGVITNIHEKKIAEQKLREEQRNYETLINSTSNLICNIDRKWNIVTANKSLMQTVQAATGRKISIGDSLIEFINTKPQKTFKWVDLFEKALSGEHCQEEQHVLIPETGIDTWVENTLNPIFDHNEIIGVAIHSENISVRKKSEIELESNRILLQSMFHKHISIMLLIDANDFRIVDANESAVNFYGYMHEVLCTMHLSDLSCVSEQKILYNSSLIKSSKKLNLIVRHRLSSGETRTLEVRSSLITENNRELYFSVIQDITEKILAEKETIKLKRIYEFTSQVNDIILNAKNEYDIFSKLCKLAIDITKFRFAFIADLDENTRFNTPLFWAGYNDGYLEIIKKIVSDKDITAGKNLYGKTVREGEYFYSNDIENDPSLAIWREEALKRGYRSSITLPIILNNETVYVLTFCASTVNFFNDKVNNSLLRVVENISYALNTFYINNKRKEAELQLKKVLQAVEQSFSSIVISDVKGDIEYVNPAFCNLSGYSSEEVIGKNPRILKSGLTTDKEYYNLWQKLTHAETWSGEFYNKKKNGEFYWEHVVISPIINFEGVITNYVAVKDDITERKKLENNLNEKLRIIDVTQSVANIGTYILDVKPNIWKCSAICDLIFDVDATYIKTGDSFFSLMLPSCRDGVRKAFYKSLQDKSGFITKFQIKRNNDQQIRWVETYGKFIYDESGNPLQLIGAMQDVTEVENLFMERKRIIDSISDYFCVIDKALILKYYNIILAKRFFNIEDDSLIGINLNDIFSNTETFNFKRYLDKAYTTGESVHFEIYADREDKIAGWYEIHLYPFENGCSIILRDITNRKKAEQDLVKLNEDLKVKTEELINTNSELGQFAYVASHDLQEPLRMVSSFMQLFEKKYADLVDETGKKYIYFAVDGAERMRTLIRDLLQYSRAGSGSLEIEEVNMNEVMKEVLLLFGNETYLIDAEIIVGNLPVIKAGKSSIIQVMQNLIGNALKYRGAEKPVIHISGAENEIEWLISVKDNGIGIDPKYAEKIFTIFQRLHRKDEYSGTGIGLAICKKIAERYKGKISVESALGAGSTFKFSIPKERI